MAYIADRFSFAESPNGSGGTSHTLSLPSHQAGDVLYVAIFVVYNNTSFAPSGWTQLGSPPSVWHGRYYKVASSSAETMTISVRENYVVGYTVLVLRGVDNANPIDVSADIGVASGSSQTLDSPALTTTSDQSLIIYGNSFRSRVYYPLIGEDANYESIEVNTFIVLSSRQTFSAGAQASFKYGSSTLSTSLEGHMSATAFRDDGNGMLHANSYERPKPLLDYRLSLLTGNYYSQESYAWFTAVDGINVHSANSCALDNFGYRAGFVSASPGTWVGRWDDLVTPVDLSSGNLLIEAYSSNLSARVGIGGHIFVIADTTGNWRAFKCANSGELSTNGVSYRFFIDPVNSTILGSSGTIDLTDIRYIGNFHHRLSSDTSSNGLDLIVIDHYSSPLILTGGSVHFPAALPIIPLRQNTHLSTTRASKQGMGQVISHLPIQIGDGLSPTYCDLFGSSLESALPYHQVSNRMVLVSIGAIDVTVHASAADTINIRNCILRANIPSTFTIHASSSTSADYDFSGTTFDGWTVVWRDGILCNSAIFQGCTIDGKAGDFDLCRFLEASGTTAISLDAGATLTDCTFVSPGTGHAVEFTEAGTYTVTDTTFTGYGTAGTANATFLNSSGGAVTVNISGSGTPTITNSSGSTTTLAAPQATLTIVANVSLVGAEVRIYDLDGLDGDYGSALDGVESHNAATFVLTDEVDNLIAIQIMLDGYEELVVSHTIANLTETLNVTLTLDRNA